MRRLSLVALVVLAACGRDEADREYFLALESEKLGHPCEEQLPHMDRAIALRPDRAGYYQKRAAYRVGLQDLRGALADLDKAISIDDQPFLRYERGIARAKAGRFREALLDLDSAVERQSLNAQFYRIRAIVRASAGQADRALLDADLLLRLAPQSAESNYARGVALLALGRAREAVSRFDATLKQRPELLYVLNARADAYASLGDAARARADRSEYARRAQGYGPCRGCGVCVDPLHP